MKNKIVFILLVAAAVITLLASCGHTHEFGDWEVAKNPTCTEEGVEERVCECGEKETRAIEMIEHDIAELTEKQPTCSSPGSLKKYCKNCDYVETEEIPVDSNNHSYMKISDSATCTEGGTAVYRCVNCKNEYTESTRALGHDVKAATCTEGSSCKRCKAKLSEALGHNISDSKCTRCGYIDKDWILNFIDIIELRYKINSADGFELFIRFVNKSNKTIKYVDFTVTPYNRVGDKAYSEIGNISTTTARFTGPLEPNQSNSRLDYWLLWYNNTISNISFDSIEITYIDGSVMTFTRNVDRAVADWR